MKHMILSAAFLMSVVAACAADLPSLPTARQTIDDTSRAAALKSWKISLVPLVASQGLDAASSYGMRELNPLLASANGGFEMKATTIKLGVTGALVGVEYLIVRKYPRSTRVISKLNWTSGIVTTGFAIHNYAIK
jgi:hypothetical protein